MTKRFVTQEFIDNGIITNGHPRMLCEPAYHRGTAPLAYALSTDNFILMEMSDGAERGRGCGAANQEAVGLWREEGWWGRGE